MRNLAGKKENTFCDEEIRLELDRAGIKVVDVDQSEGEVQYSVIGELVTSYGTITFRRAWNYWMVDCKVPLELAKKIYAHPEGKVSVRAGGHCDCPSPETQARYYHEGKEACTKAEYELGLEFFSNPGREDLYDKWVAECTPVDDPKACEGFVSCYHIDDQAGLFLFVLMVAGKL
jgi:hypothetical protein